MTNHGARQTCCGVSNRYSADAGSYALSGQHAAFTVSLAGGAGSYAPTGNDAG